MKWIIKIFFKRFRLKKLSKIFTTVQKNNKQRRQAGNEKHPYVGGRREERKHNSNGKERGKLKQRDNVCIVYWLGKPNCE